MECGAVTDAATITPPAGGLLAQNADESNYGIPLAAGYYRRITMSAQHEVCVYVVTGGLDSVGNNVFSSSVTGEFASSAKNEHGSEVLADLESGFSVLLAQIGVYEGQLGSCQGASESSCSRAVGEQVARQFDQFLNNVK